MPTTIFKDNRVSTRKFSRQKFESELTADNGFALNENEAGKEGKEGNALGDSVNVNKVVKINSSGE